jgi:hypothetical protein
MNANKKKAEKPKWERAKLRKYKVLQSVWSSFSSLPYVFLFAYIRADSRASISKK